MAISILKLRNSGQLCNRRYNSTPFSWQYLFEDVRPAPGAGEPLEMLDKAQPTVRQMLDYPGRHASIEVPMNVSLHVTELQRGRLAQTDKIAVDYETTAVSRGDHVADLLEDQDRVV